MKLKYHKIKNTPLDICTAEAVIDIGKIFKSNYL